VIFGDHDYYRMLPIGAGDGVKKIDENWRQFLFQFQDIPTEKLTELHVGFDLMGPGEVYIDDVQIYDLYLKPKQRTILKLSSDQLGAKLASPRYDVGDCHRFLSGYWPKYLQRHMRDDGPKDRVAAKPVETETLPQDGSRSPLRRVRDALPSFKFGRDNQRE
jgi:hypothetical protein